MEAFQSFDKSNRGLIPNKSLIHALRQAGLNPTEVKNVVYLILLDTIIFSSLFNMDFKYSYLGSFGRSVNGNGFVKVLSNICWKLEPLEVPLGSLYYCSYG